MIQFIAKLLLFALLLIVVFFVSGNLLEGVLPLEVREFSERITNTLNDTRDGASGFLARLFRNTSSCTHA